MRKLVTYNKSQYKALIDQLGVDGFKLMSLLELHGSDQISELLSEKKLVVDVSSFMGLLSGDLQLASKFELLVHQLPFGTLFIGDDKTVNEGAYQLRTMFDDIIDCDIEVDEGTQKDKRGKRTLVSLDELEFMQVLTTLESELIGQIEFKRSFESRSRSFRLFNALGEQPVFSLLLLGPSGVGKTEVAKILCEAIAPCQPLPKVNLGNYSSKDSLNSLIGSPRGYMGSEEGELGKKIDSSDAGILLVDEFEKAEPAVWNFFLDLLETGSFTDSQGMEHDLRGFIIVFTTNCPLGKIDETFPAELLSRFSLMSLFSKLSISDKKLFVERYVSMFARCTGRLISRVCRHCRTTSPTRQRWKSTLKRPKTSGSSRTQQDPGSANSWRRPERAVQSRRRPPSSTPKFNEYTFLLHRIYITKSRLLEMS